MSSQSSLLIRGKGVRQEGKVIMEAEVRVRETPALLALVMGEKATSLGMQAASRIWEGKEMDSSRASRKHSVLPT